VIFHAASQAGRFGLCPAAAATAEGRPWDAQRLGGKVQAARNCFLRVVRVYGDPQGHPQPETYGATSTRFGPRGSTTKRKRYAEGDDDGPLSPPEGVDTAITAIQHLGQRMRPHDGRGDYEFVRQALENKALTVFGRTGRDEELLVRRTI